MLYQPLLQLYLISSCDSTATAFKQDVLFLLPEVATVSCKNCYISRTKHFRKIHESKCWSASFGSCRCPKREGSGRIPLLKSSSDVTGSTYVKWVCEKVLLIVVCVIARLSLEEANLKGTC